MAFLDIIIFILSLFVLIKGANYFVESASKIANFLGISEFLIGITLVAIGTSLPELATAISSSIAKNTDVVLGTIIGSNIANIGLILGISAFIATLEIKKEIFNRDGIFLLFITLLFFVFAFDKTISLIEGLFMLLLFFSYIIHLYRSKFSRRINYAKYLSYFWKLAKPATYAQIFNNYKKGSKRAKRRYSIREIFRQDMFYQLSKQFIIFFFGLILLYIGAKYIIPSALNIALFLKVPETVVALLMIAVGTSLPELMVSVTAINRGLNNILIGNILGSNVANLLLVGGLSALINPLLIDNLMLFYLIPVMLLMVVLFLLFIRSSWVIKMFEGLFLLIVYILFILILFMLL